MHKKTYLKKLIHDKISQCTRCEYYKNGKALPYIPENPKYIIIGEAPHKDEIEQNSFFVGKSGQFLFEQLKNICNLDRSDFIILNSVMCMPTKNKEQSIGKPTQEIINLCFTKRTNLLNQIKNVYGINHILCLGTYARFIFTNKLTGITNDIGKTEKLLIGGDEFKITYCTHPSACFYNPKNKNYFTYSLTQFLKEITN